MAGHSKWANIKFRKSVQDAKRGKIFTKLIREISVAARLGGADESTNSRLRDVVSKALKANMKRDTIDNAIKRGAGGLEGANMTEMRYEGYGPAGVAVRSLPARSCRFRRRPCRLGSATRDRSAIPATRS